MAQQQFEADRERTEAAERTQRWFEAVAKIKPGKELLEHMGHVDMVTSGRSNECPNEQAAEFRTVFFAGLNKSIVSFNMPPTLPKFIVVCNLSGLRRLYYSNEHPELVTLLTRPPSAASDVSAKVQEVLDFAKKSNMSVLLSYALPYQAGCDRAFWDLRTVVYEPGKGIVDGQRAYDSTKTRPTQVGCSKNAAANIPETVLQAQIERFRMQMSAVDMDLEPSDDASDQARGTGSSQGGDEVTRDRLEAKVGLLSMVLKQKEKMYKLIMM